MIVGFVGSPGSGKTYEAVKKIIDNLARGRRVFTNIDGMDKPECHEAIKSVCNLSDGQFLDLFHFLSHEEVSRFWEIAPPKSLIVIDEVHKFFSNRDWQSEKNKVFADWASTHRHGGYDLVLITQDAAKVEGHIRSMFEWSYLFRKVNFFGSAVQNKYLCHSYANAECSGQPLARNVRHYNSKIFLCYKSYISDDIKEQGFMTHVNVFKHPIFVIIPVVLAFTLYMFFAKSSFATGDIFGTSAVLNKNTVSTPAPSEEVLPSKETNDEPFEISPTVQVTDHPSPVIVTKPPDTTPENHIYSYLTSDGRTKYVNRLEFIPSGSAHKLVF